MATEREDDFKPVEGAELPEYGEFYQWSGFGDKVEGTYIRHRKNPPRTVDGQYFKEQTLYDIQGEAGDIWTVNGNFDLDSKMKKVRVGNRVRITYQEDKDLGPNLTGMRIFDVRQAPPLKK